MRLSLATKSLRLRALGMMAAILVVVIAALTLALTWGFTSGYKEALLAKSQILGGQMRNDLSKTLNLGLPLESFEGVNEKLKDLVDKNESIGYCIITDTTGKVLFASDAALMGTTLTDTASKDAAKAEKDIPYQNYKYKDKDYYDTVLPLTDAEKKRVGVIRIGLGHDGVDKRQNDLLLRSSLIALISLAVAIFGFALFITKFITDPISYLVKTATQIAKGDLTRTIEVRSQDELHALGEAINTMVSNLKSMLARVKDASISVANATERIAINSKKISQGAQAQQELTENTSSAMEEMNVSIREVAESVESLFSSAESSSSSIMQMAASIDEVASSTSELSTSSEATSSSIIEMAASIRQVAENVDILSSAAEETTASATEISASIREVESASRESTALTERSASDAAELGMKSVEKTIESMEDIRHTVDRAASVIAQLGERSEEIGEILVVIDEVTDQTSLLALNAAILAAQAGEHGKGFAVVATEIKELAERTSSSTSEIAKLINAVQTEARDAVSSIKSGKDSVLQGVKIAYEAKDALVKIVESSTRAANMSKSIEKATFEQAEGIKQVSDAMLSITDMVQQILKASQEQSMGTEQIMTASEKMSEITKQVKNAMMEQAKGSKQITMAVENVSEKVQHIAAATAEQRRGSEAIVESIEKIRDITGQSVDLAKEMDQSVMELSLQADLLREQINHFVLMGSYDLGAGGLRLGVAPLEEHAAMKGRFEALGAYLSEKLGVKVEVVVGDDLGGTVNDLGSGRTDIAYLSPTTYIEARHKYGAELIAKVVSNGRPFAHTVIVTREQGGVKSVADLFGKSFAFGDEKSTTSSLMPRAMLLEAGVRLQDLRSFKYLGRHDEVARAVAEGEYDAGGLMDTVALRFAQKGLKVLKVSPDMPNFNICAGKNLDKGVRENIKKAVIDLKPDNPMGLKVLKAVHADCDGLVEAKDSDYDGIRKMVKELYGITYK